MTKTEKLKRKNCRTLIELLPLYLLDRLGERRVVGTKLDLYLGDTASLRIMFEPDESDEETG